MAVVADVRVDDVDVDDEISSSDVAIDADVEVMPMPLDMLDAEPEMKNESFPILKSVSGCAFTTLHYLRNIHMDTIS